MLLYANRVFGSTFVPSVRASASSSPSSGKGRVSCQKSPSTLSRMTPPTCSSS